MMGTTWQRLLTTRAPREVPDKADLKITSEGSVFLQRVLNF